MADTDLLNKPGFVDTRRSNKGQGTAPPVASVTNYGSIAAMRTRLTAVNAGYYTAARLNQMTANDMVMAIRQADDAAGIK